jgi:hypothetical protein
LEQWDATIRYKQDGSREESALSCRGGASTGLANTVTRTTAHEGAPQNENIVNVNCDAVDVNSF